METSVIKKKVLEMRLWEKQGEQNAWREHRCYCKGLSLSRGTPCYLHHFHFRLFYRIGQSFVQISHCFKSVKKLLESSQFSQFTDIHAVTDLLQLHQIQI